MLTEAQRQTHHLYVGSSMISKIIGVHPRENISDAFLYATQRLDGNGTSTDANRGIALEGYVLDMYERENEVQLVRDIQLFSEVGEDGRGFCANLDAAILTEVCEPDEEGFERCLDVIEAPVEAKTSNDPSSSAYTEVPLHVVVQVQWEILHCGPRCRYGIVPVWLASFGRFVFKTFRVERDDTLIEELRYAGFDFLDHVRRDVMPEDVTPHLETLKSIRREPNSIISLGDEAGEAWADLEAAKREAKHWTSTVDERKQAVLAMLGDAEAGRLPSGETITYLSQNGARQIDLDILQYKAPELYAELVSQPTHRVLRKAKAKAGKRRQ